MDEINWLKLNNIKIKLKKIKIYLQERANVRLRYMKAFEKIYIFYEQLNKIRSLSISVIETIWILAKIKYLY